MTQQEFIQLAQKLASELLNLRDTTSEQTPAEDIADGEQPSYFLCGRVDRKDVADILAYAAPPDAKPEKDPDSLAIDEAYREAAKEQWEREGEIEIDSNAVVSKGDDPGAYVAAWVWVRDKEQDSADDDE